MYKVPFSKTKIIFETFPARNWNEFRTGFMVALRKAGWEVYLGNPISNAFSESPQGFRCSLSLKIGQYSYHKPVVSILVGNFWHNLRVGENIRYQIVVNKCQIFLSRPQVEFDPLGSCFVYAIPMSLDDIGRFVCWSDSYGDPSFISSNPRTNLLDSYFGTKPYILTRWGCEGTEYIRGEANPPQILSVTAPVALQYIPKRYQSPTLLYPNSAIGFPALVAWKSIHETDISIKGVLWDAMVTTHVSPMDAMAPDEKGNLWINYTHEYLYGSLWLLIGPYKQFRRSNYAY